MEPITLLAILVLPGVVVIAAGVQSNKRRTRRLRELASRLDDGQLRVDEGWLADLAGARIRGTLEGHRVEVAYKRHPIGLADGRGRRRTVVNVRVRVEVFDPVADELTIEPAVMLTKVGRALGLVHDVKTGDDRVDAKYILNGQPAALGHLLSEPQAERALDALLGEHAFLQVGLYGRWVYVDKSTTVTDPDWLETVLSLLLQVAKLCDRTPIEVKVLGDAAHFAWTGGGQEALCPYCRDGIDPQALELAACEACDTVHHRACLDEAGGCVVFGCGGGKASASRRARTG
jgi:hypothetical protein